MQALAILVGIGAFILLLLWLGARRFAAKERRLGKWDQYGPLVETQPPPHQVKSGLMSWRLEVVGKWKGRVLRQRRPKEKPSDTAGLDI